LQESRSGNGGASGLGEATVRRLVADGAQVVFFDVDEVKAAKVVSELGGKAEFRKVDVQPAENKAAVITQGKYGRLDILCNIAGRGKAVPIVGKEGPCALDDFTSIVDLNLTAGFDLMRLCAWEMSKIHPKTKTVKQASSSIPHPSLLFTARTASRLTRHPKVGSTPLPSRARGLAKRGIRVAAIAPGLFLTPIYDKVPQSRRIEENNCIP
jgi:NAD(P)-dependent dehydrogenase (short-subunit alcohol dehydrogenase family)